MIRARQIDQSRIRPAKMHPPLKDDPTPEEIAARCAEIRSGWTAEDYIARDMLGRHAVLRVEITVCRMGYTQMRGLDGD